MVGSVRPTLWRLLGVAALLRVIASLNLGGMVVEPLRSESGEALRAA